MASTQRKTNQALKTEKTLYFTCSHLQMLAFLKAAAVGLDNNLAHELQTEMSRRELLACRDIEDLRTIALRLLGLMESQRAVTLQLIQKGWLPEH